MINQSDYLILIHFNFTGAINIWAHGYLQQAGHSACNISPMNIRLSITMYFSYFVLFARFFYKAYLSDNARKGKKSQHSESIKAQQPQMDHKIKAQ